MLTSNTYVDRWSRGASVRVFATSGYVLSEGLYFKLLRTDIAQEPSKRPHKAHNTTHMMPSVPHLDTDHTLLSFSLDLFLFFIFCPVASHCRTHERQIDPTWTLARVTASWGISPRSLTHITTQQVPMFLKFSLTKLE